VCIYQQEVLGSTVHDMDHTENEMPNNASVVACAARTCLRSHCLSLVGWGIHGHTSKQTHMSTFIF
jgi:hypothetical protein